MSFSMRRLALPVALLATAAATRYTPFEALVGNDDGEVEEANKNSSALELDRAPASDLVIMSWNMQDFDDKDRDRMKAADKKKKITARLKNLLSDSGASVVLLQEIANCDLLDQVLKSAPKYKCVGSVVDAGYEARSWLVLGNVILYDSKLFDAPKQHVNEVLATKWNEWAHYASYKNNEDAVFDANGKTLASAHKEMCNDKKTGWKAFGKKPCNLNSDLQSATSVVLKPKKGMWTEPAAQALANGMRFIDLHLFSGKSSGLAQQQNGGRRAFQFRTHIWRTKYWQQQSGKTYPTIYAGDFNTASATELKQVVAEQAAAFNVNTECLLEGSPCKDVQDKQMKPTLGRNYPLDHVVLDRTGFPSNIAMSTTPKIYKIEREVADHAPISVAITFRSSAASKPAGQKSGAARTRPLGAGAWALLLVCLFACAASPWAR